MPKYNFFISCSHKDKNLMNEIATSLRVLGYSVYHDEQLPIGSSWRSVIEETIAESECFIPVITDAFLSSEAAKQELIFSLKLSQGRAQAIFPLCFTEKLPTWLELEFDTRLYFTIHQPGDLQAAINAIDRAVSYSTKASKLYERLAEYRDVKQGVKRAQTIMDLISLTLSQWEISTLQERRRLGLELCRLLHLLEYNPCDYTAESKKFGYSMLGSAGAVAELLQSNKPHASLFLSDLFFISLAVRIVYYEREIRMEGIDLGTSGDVFTGAIDPCPIAEYIKKQQPYVQAFTSVFASMKDRIAKDASWTPEEIEFITQTSSFFLDSQKRFSVGTSAGKKAEPLSEDEEILQSIAKFMQEGNKLFDLLQKHGAAGDFLKCLLTSYERLKNYCQIVGAVDVAADCVDRIVEIRDQLDKVEDSSTHNDKAENGIKSLLGLTLSTGDHYDVFISFKDQDSDLAEKIYQLCHQHMKVPFWSKRSLPELSKSEYAQAIYQALDRSSHFVVVLSKLDYLYTDWISQEMTIFHREITEGRKSENANFIFVATDNLYQTIIGNNKKDLPIEYRGYQIIKMSDYQNTLLQYIN